MLALIDGKVDVTPKEGWAQDRSRSASQGRFYDSGVTVAEMDVTVRGKKIVERTLRGNFAPAGFTEISPLGESRRNDFAQVCSHPCRFTCGRHRSR